MLAVFTGARIISKNNNDTKILKNKIDNSELDASSDHNVIPINAKVKNEPSKVDHLDYLDEQSLVELLTIIVQGFEYRSRKIKAILALPPSKRKRMLKSPVLKEALESMIDETALGYRSVNKSRGRL